LRESDDGPARPGGEQRLANRDEPVFQAGRLVQRTNALEVEPLAKLAAETGGLRMPVAVGHVCV
jgi:hypothetical protein